MRSYLKLNQIDDNEVSLESPTVTDDESEPLSEQMETLNLGEPALKTPQPRSEPQYERPRRHAVASVARQQTYPVRNDQPQQYYRTQQPRQLGQARPMQYPKPSRTASGRPKLQFRSHYGPNGALLSTQDKARRLYHSCFG